MRAVNDIGNEHTVSVYVNLIHLVKGFCLSVPNLENVIKEYGLNCNFIHTHPDLNTNTDASAYQAALQSLKVHGNKYDVYWFGHTKGGSNPREGERQMYINEFFSKRKEKTVEAIINKIVISLIILFIFGIPDK
jgi:hypothetical protein